jgi:hypothetical protein
VCNPNYYNNYYEYTARMSDMIISKQIDMGYYHGAFINNAKPCSIGTIVEGLVASYKIMVYTEKETTNIYKAIERSIVFLMNSQIHNTSPDNKLHGGIPTCVDWAVKPKNKTAGTIRIDNVQHVLSALITASTIL